MDAGNLQVQLKATLKIVSKTRFNLQEKFLMASRIKNFRNRRPQCVIKENSGYENFDHTNVAASLLMLFHCSGKESRLQKPCEFPESAPTPCLQLLST
jgi:hypothetical protein